MQSMYATTSNVSRGEKNAIMASHVRHSKLSSAIFDCLVDINNMFYWISSFRDVCQVVDWVHSSFNLFS